MPIHVHFKMLKHWTVPYTRAPRPRIPRLDLGSRHQWTGINSWSGDGKQSQPSRMTSGCHTEQGHATCTCHSDPGTKVRGQSANTLPSRQACWEPTFLAQSSTSAGGKQLRRRKVSNSESYSGWDFLGNRFPHHSQRILNFNRYFSWPDALLVPQSYEALGA